MAVACRHVVTLPANRLRSRLIQLQRRQQRPFPAVMNRPERRPYPAASHCASPARNAATSSGRSIPGKSSFGGLAERASI